MSRKIQDLIDEHKQKIPENLYLELCNANKLNYQNENEELTKVEVQYAYPLLDLDNRFDSEKITIFVNIITHTKQVKLTIFQLEEIQNNNFNIFMNHLNNQKVILNTEIFILKPLILGYEILN